MKKFTTHTGIVAAIDRANVDTDMIIPKQFLKSIKRSGFGPNLFDELRYLDKGEPGKDSSNRPLNMNFSLNQPRFHNASILLARRNFGCGSSREHAPWALEDFGFRVIIAPSYADIFFNNCFKNGILPIVLDEETVSSLFAEMNSQEGYSLTVDLENQRIIKSDGNVIGFEVDSFNKYCLMSGLDDIGLTLQDKDVIENFEHKWQQKSPWLFAN